MTAEDGWPDDIGSVLGRELIAARRVPLAHVDAHGLLWLLNKMPAEVFANIQMGVGMKVTSVPTEKTAIALAARLRNGRTSVQLGGILFRPLRKVFFCPDPTQDQWAAMLFGDWERAVSAIEPDLHLAWHLWLCQQNMPPELFPPALAMATFTAPGREVPAVAFFAAQDPALADAYERARGRFPGLPVARASFQDVLPDALLAQANGRRNRKRVERLVQRANDRAARSPGDH